MAIRDSSEFDRSRRFVYIDYQPTFGTVAGIVSPGGDRGLEPVFLPYSLVETPDGSTYVESNHTFPTVNSADTWSDVVYFPPLWGEIVAVQPARMKADIFAWDDPTRVLHRFGGL